MISDFNGIDAAERQLYVAAISNCSKMVHDQKIPVKDAVERIVTAYSMLGTISDIDNLKKVLYEEVTQESSKHNVIKSEEVCNRHWWTDFKADVHEPKKYWNRYYDYLSSKPGWSVTSVRDLDDSTDEVMNYLANPIAGKPDERRGLVYGDVQSGKTAHYLGLINKAYSAGYKIIIVLTGMQNSLRSQTQSRVDEEVLGYETSTENIEQMLQEALQNSIGVANVISNSEVGNILQSLTNRDENGDFNKSIKSTSITPPYIIVTKKVKSPLKNILEYLTTSTIAENEHGKNFIPATYPALIIDDEADQASVNTKNMEKSEDPTTINGLIRKILNVFKCKSYVGYTATPFANIFIPHRTDDDVYGKDLFPKDFIAETPRPELYVGAREFFGLGDEEPVTTMPLYREIIKGKDFLGKGTAKNAPIGELPDELKEAVKYFLISTAVRNLRGQRNKPNTMLVHIVRYVDQQDIIKRRLQDYVQNEVFNYIQFGDYAIHDEFQSIYDTDYIPTTKKLKIGFSKYMKGCDEVDFTVVWAEIRRIVEKRELVVWSVNSNSSDGLIYKNYEDMPFNVIAVGGDKLSRGLTLEGLTISYFTRAAGAMDTLMQMGRWFGFRPGYLDLCRLYTTSDLYNKFEIISYSVANLISQFDDMNTLKTDPEHFGLKVATDPSILISARNKVRAGTDYQADFSAKLTQTRLLDADPEIIENNYETVDALLSSLDQNRLDVPGHKTYNEITGRNRSKGKYFWTGVSGTVIADFFDHYHTSKSATKASGHHIADYIREMMKFGGLTDWTICLAGTGETPTSKIAVSSQWPISVHGIERNKDKGPDYPVVDSVTRDLHVLTSSGDEELDYREDVRKKAEHLRERLKTTNQNNAVVAREVRSTYRGFGHGFLLLYPIEKVAEDIKTQNEKAPYAFAVVFPDRKDKGKLKSYKLNEVAMEMNDDE
ncbi:Z1 domain-containing protein [Stecheria sp. CLA-KB-P133]|uniref:Z1 domain-containing protein n=1 Tax=Grylomicrobium aquisgranensis TaxID=2926318 RepID=A0AB35U5E6_9FIRM|nr:Z1 domain-containing protein [Stecheria sp. CLA-KB-P133]